MGDEGHSLRNTPLYRLTLAKDQFERNHVVEQCFAQVTVDLMTPTARNEVREYLDTLM
jgi:hypothetical protein